MTASNPPLNKDCVIAFAESEDKESERGVLRQVRSERHGVFAEEYVVLATRFFVAGNQGCWGREGEEIDRRRMCG